MSFLFLFQSPQNLIFNIQFYSVLFLIIFVTSLFHPALFDGFLLIYFLRQLPIKNSHTLYVLFCFVILLYFINIFANYMANWASISLLYYIKKNHIHVYNEILYLALIFYKYQSSEIMTYQRIIFINIIFTVSIPFLYFWAAIMEDSTRKKRMNRLVMNQFIFVCCVKALLFDLFIWAVCNTSENYTHSLMNNIVLIRNILTYFIIIVTVFFIIKSIIYTIYYILNEIRKEVKKRIFQTKKIHELTLEYQEKKYFNLFPKKRLKFYRF